MRISRLLSVTLVLATTAAATIVACGGDSTPSKTDAGVIRTDGGGGGNVDAGGGSGSGSGGGGNALGQLCPFGSGGTGTPCPTGNDCVALNGLGSTTTGYCTPNCGGMNTVCTTGYTGPAGGMPVCALSVGSGSAPTGCAIICTSPNQCPTGMGCVVAQGTTKICVPN